jgi:hypothetical protein
MSEFPADVRTRIGKNRLSVEVLDGGGSLVSDAAIDVNPVESVITVGNVRLTVGNNDWFVSVGGETRGAGVIDKEQAE